MFLEDRWGEKYKIFSIPQYERLKGFRNAGYKWILPNMHGCVMFWKKEPKNKKEILKPDLMFPIYDVSRESRLVEDAPINIDYLLEEWEHWTNTIKRNMASGGEGK